MRSDNHIRIALLFSIGIHAILLSPMPGFLQSPHSVEQTNIEVTYIEVEKEKLLDVKPVIREAEKLSLKKDIAAPAPPTDTPKDIAGKKGAVFAKKIKDIAKENKRFKAVVSEKGITADTVLDLNSISTQAGSSESLNYLRSIRDKISLYVHKNYDTSLGEGEVQIHFILNSSGRVKSVAILRDNLGNKNRLKNLCLDSIYHSSPFKPFPGDLDLAQAAFNISISFKRDSI